MRPAVRLVLTAVAVLPFMHCVAAAQDRSAGLNLAYNEFSAFIGLPLEKNESLRLSLNLDMSGVISGEYLFPGISADAVYLFSFGSSLHAAGESSSFFAGPGISAGYVRNLPGSLGIMAALTGCFGFEYTFAVPVSLSVSLEPSIGIHINEDEFGYVTMDFYKTGFFYSLLPHIGIKYRF